MSLGVIIKAPSGIVLAAESRVTLTTMIPSPAGNQMLHSTFDNANKLFTFSEPYNKFGVVTYGAAGIGSGTVETYIPEFETTLEQKERELHATNGGERKLLCLKEFAEHFRDFFKNQWEVFNPPNAPYMGPDMTFNVAGYEDNEPYGTVYTFDIPRKPDLKEQSPKKDGQYQFTIVYGGQKEIVDRLVMGLDTRWKTILIQNGFITPDKVAAFENIARQFQLQIPVQFMPLQDCVNLAALFIKTTIETQNLTVGLRGCGGAIDLAIITRNSTLKFIKKKEIVVD